MPSNTNTNTYVNTISPWTGYLEEGQYATVDDKAKKSRSKVNKDEDQKIPNPSAVQESSKLVPAPVVELRRLDLGDSGSRASTADLARFSINGMLSLVEQRISMEERRQAPAQMNAGLGLSVGRSAGVSHTRSTNQMVCPFSLLSTRLTNTSV